MSSKKQKAFLLSIDSPEAHECIHQIQAYFSNSTTAEVHFTSTNGGDLRVRAKRDQKGQNAFTMYWQKSEQRFFCRIYVADDKCQLPPLPSFLNVRETTTQGEPLHCEFHYQPDWHNGALINFIEASVAHLSCKKVQKRGPKKGSKKESDPFKITHIPT